MQKMTVKGNKKEILYEKFNGVEFRGKRNASRETLKFS